MLRPWARRLESLVLLLGVAVAVPATATPATVVPAPASAEMNGYTLKGFGDFAKDWHLVTIRFRKDTSEMRITYANEAAWNSLLKGGASYPDGAVFAKIGIMTVPDLAFPSSAVPAGSRRVQFMVRDKSKHAETDGWGYALFDMDGNTFPGDAHAASMACAACHRLVPERGYVFSQRMGVELSASSLPWTSRMVFEDLAREKLPALLRGYVDEKHKSVRSLKGELTRHVFQGTLDEVAPLLADEAARSGRPAVLIGSGSGPDFSLVMADEGAKACAVGKPMKSVHSMNIKTNPVYENRFCHQP